MLPPIHLLWCPWQTHIYGTAAYPCSRFLVSLFLFSFCILTSQFQDLIGSVSLIDNARSGWKSWCVLLSTFKKRNNLFLLLRLLESYPKIGQRVKMLSLEKITDIVYCLQDHMASIYIQSCTEAMVLSCCNHLNNMDTSFYLINIDSLYYLFRNQ